MSSKCLRTVAVAFVAAGLAAATVAAQPADKRTYFTFSGPVAIPGATLPAGRYLFRVADSSGRDVIQVLSADGRTPLGMFFGQRVQRPDAPDAPEIRFLESGPGMPAAIQSWWYLGERSGYEFVYPKAQARLLAQGAGQPVLTTVTETKAPPETGAAPLARVSPQGEDLSVETPTPVPVPGPVQRGEIAPPSIAIAEPVQRARAGGLPRTASVLPLVGLVSVLSLLGAAAMRRWRIAA
jgi:hypothetical protein